MKTRGDKTELKIGFLAAPGSLWCIWISRASTLSVGRTTGWCVCFLFSLVQLIVRKWPFQPDTGRIQKGVKWAIQASTGRIQKGSKWEIQACCTEKKGEKGRRKREWDRELCGAQIALLILDSSFFYNWLYKLSWLMIMIYCDSESSECFASQGLCTPYSLVVPAACTLFWFALCIKMITISTGEIIKMCGNLMLE